MTLLDSMTRPVLAPARKLLQKNIHRWALPWALQAGQKALLPQEEGRGPRHLIFCFCDHYEPEHGAAGVSTGEARVRAWQKGYGPAFTAFRDADGRPPQHSFFFPGEEYRPAYLDRLTELISAGYGEIELHLHHKGDTADTLRRKIEDYLGTLGAHGHFSREAGSGRARYGFIHGDWALANAHKNGYCCGVDSELLVLFETGCYADFTFPSAPHPTQPRLVNQIYWPAGDRAALSRARSYDRGVPARVGSHPRDRLLLVQGPLALALRKGTLRPRIEGAAITAKDPPTPERVATWVRQGIHVRGRPEWIFVKIHTHGAPEAQGQAIMGPPGQALHRELCARYNDGGRWMLHYVTARELYNIACAAMDGLQGNPGGYRDYDLQPPPAAPHEMRAAVPMVS